MVVVVQGTKLTVAAAPLETTLPSVLNVTYMVDPLLIRSKGCPTLPVSRAMIDADEVDPSYMVT